MQIDAIFILYIYFMHLAYAQNECLSYANMLWISKITGSRKAATCWEVCQCGCREKHAIKAEAGVWWGLHFKAGGDVQGHGTQQGHKHCIQAGRTVIVSSGLRCLVHIMLF